ATAAATVAALPSMMGSPHPTIPSSVSILRNSHRGGTVYVVIDVIFIGLAVRSNVVVDVAVFSWCSPTPRRSPRPARVRRRGGRLGDRARTPGPGLRLQRPATRLRCRLLFPRRGRARCRQAALH